MKETLLPADKPTILTFVRHYLPGYKAGGPIRSIENLVEALGDEFNFRIVTSDRDATDTEPYPGLDGRDEWKAVGKARVLYLPPSKKGLRTIIRLLRETPYDILYLNSYFDPVFTIQPLLARRFGLAPERRCIVAPRGEFSEGALDLKASKKKLFLLVARAVGLYRDLRWHASTPLEKRDIQQAMGGGATSIHVAVNMPSASVRVNPDGHCSGAEGEPLRICFLSRISPKKNLHFALEVLRQVRAPVCFDVFGPIRDAEYWIVCQELMSQLPSSVKAAYRGSLDHKEVASTLSRYDLFFLPTLGENYGHVILESLSAGTPVLIADTTPWRSLADLGVGWELPLDGPARFAEKIDHMARMGHSELVQMRARTSSFAESRRADVSIVAENRKLFAVTLT